MLLNKQETFKALLDLHKLLLEKQKGAYEKKYGEIGNTNQYFQLVVSHEDFEWLRQLSVLIAAFDESLENDNQDTDTVTKEIYLLLSGEKNSDFYHQLKIIIDDNQIATELINNIIESLKNPA